jgi:two-component system sensor histidine kinase TctE
LIGFLASWLLTSFLLRPISNLSGFLDEISSEGTAYRELPSLPPSVTAFPGAGNPQDEMTLLLGGLGRLIERINRGYRTSRAWSFQMAHELKTPLAIIEAEVNQALRDGEIEPKPAASIQEELMQASEAVTAFLSWAEIEKPVDGAKIYAHKISEVLAEIVRRGEKQFPGRLRLENGADFSVLARAQHLEMMLGNLVRNALLYSPALSTVTLRTGKTFLEVIDHGPGFAAEVTERWGEPFNKGSSGQKGHGLGLAFVVSVCRLYQWPLSLRREEDKTLLRVEFPAD